MPPDSAPPDPPRAEVRRAQILAAAGDCFRSKGFHGASIAQISRIAGMSPGHIYHYFENKEAIIAAIVAQDLEHVLAMTASLRVACNMKEAMVEHVADGVERSLEPRAAGLNLEILAEAARNPHVADIVRSADRVCRGSLALTLRDLRRAGGHDDDEATIAGMIEVLAAMFEGLASRSIRNPELDRSVVVRLFEGALRDLLSQNP
ncbi:transcriptional regulator, TetR family [Aromatoleum aromaticum EbN1]|uniref:Transcriptional regulator, TetR family n=1 Tax=Aromatoleum aromaticum (strain DSM 19018 / LMG 30748 / EbN1) TaxID=76114 RepID=Q5P651_AROAE|nr:TetR/AcrR family transcriptional regulator [Aromatoleum aromaticum]CAI07210.1 transcriptional regulator, TetR family [Aromatoleum aromaticum EbN1]